MLTQDPNKRISSAQFLEHPWTKGGEASDKPLDNAVPSRMKQFRAMNKMKQLALKVKYQLKLIEIVLNLKCFSSDKFG